MTQPTSVPGRNNGFTLGTTGNLNSDYAVTYGYDIAGRLKTVTDAKGAYAYTYGYLANSRLREQVIGPVHTVTTAYESHRDVLAGIENKAGATVVSTYAYVVNNLGQRKERVNSGTAFGTASTDVFTYNDKGEVTGSTNATLTARDQSYTYDDIGNRVGSQLAGASTSYTANALNQYSELVTGSQQLAPGYDADGNQTDTGSGQLYTWDGENRLLAIKPVIPTTGDKKQLNVYDAQSRRVRKQVFIYASGTWSLTTDEKFIYDGWNLIAKYDAQVSGLSLQVSYTWGTDLSGSLQGAGGVGGLLSAKDGSSVYHYTYDANGNVSEVLNNSGGIAAHYEYDTFGNTVASSGTYTQTNAYRFSTKPLDDVSGLYYYGFRYYNPSNGRWPSRDPIQEEGGLNLYGFIGNNSCGYFDVLGLCTDGSCPGGGKWSCACASDIGNKKLVKKDVKIDFGSLDSYIDAAGKAGKKTAAKKLKDVAKKFGGNTNGLSQAEYMYSTERSGYNATYEVVYDICVASRGGAKWDKGKNFTGTVCLDGDPCLTTNEASDRANAEIATKWNDL